MGLPRDIVDGLARELAERAGLELPAWVIESRAQMRMASRGVSPAAYLELVSSGRGAAELGELIEAVRVGETRFFRHRAQVDAVIDVVVPALAARGRRPVTVWSAGCATGEEPYTLAMVLARKVPDFRIVATDVSEDALEYARGASYPRRALEHVPEEWRDAFVDDDERVWVAPAIARRVSFEVGNLVEAAPVESCSLVWCRNVLIYFAPEARRRAIEHLVGALEPGGFLFVGYSESLRDVAELDATRAGDAVVYVKRPRAPVTPVAPVRRTRAATVTPTPVPVRALVPSTVHEVHVAGNCDPDALAAQLTAALHAPGLTALAVHLDGADFVPDEVAVILRRARAAARAAGVAFTVRADRPGPSRWLRRHRLDEEKP